MDKLYITYRELVSTYGISQKTIDGWVERGIVKTYKITNIFDYHIEKEIKVFEQAIENKVKSLKDEGINSTMFWAYRMSKECGNELIDFSEVIWEKDIEEIIDACRENNIKEFTISNRMSGLIDILVAFEKLGCKMNGLTEVKAPYKDWNTNDYAVVPAIKMCIE